MTNITIKVTFVTKYPKPYNKPTFIIDIIILDIDRVFVYNILVKLI